MTTAIAHDPATELRQSVEDRGGIEPIVTVAGDTGLVSYRLAGEVRTEVWLWRDDAWRRTAVHHSVD